jgi:hypothetical protein
MKPNEMEWCWEEPFEHGHDERVHGPFDSKEACIEDIKERTGMTDSLLLPGFEHSPIKFRIGKVTYFSPEEYVVADLSEMLERMEEDANNDYGFEDSIFDAKPGAEEALKEVLGVWAKNYLTCSGWIMTDAEEVKL